VSMHPSDHPHRTVKFSAAEIGELLDQIDGRDRDAGSAGRSARRFEFRDNECAVIIQQPGASDASSFLAPTRNLSAGGMSFLHGGFVHCDSICRVIMRAAAGDMVEIPGRVVRCRHLSKLVHEVSVEFNEPINPADFCTAALKLNLLLIDADEEERRVAAHHLTVARATVETLDSCAGLLEHVKGSTFDAILLATDVGGSVDAVKSLRADGYGRPIIGILPAAGGTDLADVGCTRCVSKPYTPDLISGIVKSLTGANEEGDALAA